MSQPEIPAGFVRIPVDPRVKGMPASAEAFEAKINHHKYGILRVTDEIAPGDTRVNITVAAKKATNTPAPWRVMVYVCHTLDPDKHFCIGIPQRRYWLNPSNAQATLYATEIKDAALTQTWEAAGTGDEPT